MPEESQNIVYLSSRCAELRHEHTALNEQPLWGLLTAKKQGLTETLHLQVRSDAGLDKTSANLYYLHFQAPGVFAAQQLPQN
jgi:hypothetical protein